MHEFEENQDVILSEERAERRRAARAARERKRRRMKLIALAVLVAVVAAAAVLLLGGKQNVKMFRKKANLLKETVLTETLIAELGSNPAGDVGHVVLFSLSDTAERASVILGTGETLEDAWEAANKNTCKFLKKSDLEPVWVKADAVFSSQLVTAEEMQQVLLDSKNESLRYGVALDAAYGTALLEAEMNSNRIYDYENGVINQEYLNRYLAEQGRAAVQAVPNQMLVFQTFGRFCDENNQVWNLESGGASYGRRKIEQIDAAYLMACMDEAAAHLNAQVQEDGSFAYGDYPRFDNEINGYNVLHHAQAVQAMIAAGQKTNAVKKDALDRAMGWMTEQVVYENEQTAYLYDQETGEMLPAGLAIAAMEDYMEAYGTEAYVDLCRALGEGILAQLDMQSGTINHVLNADFTVKEQSRDVSYDGQTVCGLAALYRLTGEDRWMDGADCLMYHMVHNGYLQYADCWASRAAAEMIEYVEDADFFTFVLSNAKDNETALKRSVPAAEAMEVLLWAVPVYDNLVERGAVVTGFDAEELAGRIDDGAGRLLSGWFYPEFAMYMQNPSAVLGSFMVREDGFRCRIDDLAQAIMACCLYDTVSESLSAYEAQ